MLPIKLFDGILSLKHDILAFDYNILCNFFEFQVLLLLQKTNADWWSGRRANGQEGYLPSNYVKEIEPKMVKKTVKQSVKQPVKVKVLKTGVRKELVKRPKAGGAPVRRTPSGNSSWFTFLILLTSS